jgi:mycothiol synthase
MSYQIRLYRGAEDDQKLVDLLNAVSVFDQAEEVYTVESFREEMGDPLIDAPNSYYIAETDKGEVIGDTVSVFRPTSERAFLGNIFCEILPAWRKPELGLTEALIKKSEARLIQRRSELPDDGELQATLQTDSAQEDNIKLFEQLGYDYERTYYTMIADDLANVVVPETPFGVTIRTYRKGEDDEAFINARNAAWVDHHLGSIRTLESWKHEVENERFRPDLSFLALDEQGNVVGICWCVINFEQVKAGGPKEGWVQNLATVREYRKKGVGAALLARGVAAIAKTGMERVMLGVDAASPTGAVGLYERTGFRVHKKRLMYIKKLS